LQSDIIYETVGESKPSPSKAKQPRKMLGMDEVTPNVQKSTSHTGEGFSPEDGGTLPPLPPLVPLTGVGIDDASEDQGADYDQDTVGNDDSLDELPLIRTQTDEYVDEGDIASIKAKFNKPKNVRSFFHV
jgi:hypothetical protein